jgi:glucose dehydrogenase
MRLRDVSLLLVLALPVAAQAPFQPVTDDMLANPNPNDWLMWRRTHNAWGYSPLNQVNKSNVKKLRMVWTRGMGPGVQEGTPLVHHVPAQSQRPDPGH